LNSDTRAEFVGSARGTRDGASVITHYGNSFLFTYIVIIQRIFPAREYYYYYYGTQQVSTGTTCTGVRPANNLCEPYVGTVYFMAMQVLFFQGFHVFIRHLKNIRHRKTYPVHMCLSTWASCCKWHTQQNV